MTLGSSHWLRLVVLLGPLAGGCAYRTLELHVPLAVDAPCAPVVTVVDSRAKPVDAKTAATVRDETMKLLGPLAPESVNVTLAEHVDYADHALDTDGIAIFGLWPVVLGMIYEHDKVAVDVVVAGHHGHGDGEKDGGLYAHARRRALAVALDRALASAAARR